MVHMNTISKQRCLSLIKLLLLALIVIAFSACSDDKKSSSGGLTGTSLEDTINNPSKTEDVMMFVHVPGAKTNYFLLDVYTNIYPSDEYYNEVTISSLTFTDPTVVFEGSSWFNYVTIPNYQAGNTLSYTLVIQRKNALGAMIEKTYTSSIVLPALMTNATITPAPGENTTIWTNSLTMNWTLAQNNMLQMAWASSSSLDWEDEDEAYYNLSAADRSYSFARNCVDYFGIGSTYSIGVSSLNYKLDNKFASIFYSNVGFDSDSYDGLKDKAVYRHLSNKILKTIE